MDFDGTNVTPGRKNTAITTATTTDVVLAPATSVFRNVKSLTVANKDVISCTCTVKHTDGTTTPTLFYGNARPRRHDRVRRRRGIRRPAGLRDDPAPELLERRSVPDGRDATYLTGSLITLPRTPQVGSIYRWKVTSRSRPQAPARARSTSASAPTERTADTARCSTGALDTETAIADEMVAEILATVRGPIGASCIVQSSWTFDDNLTTTGFSNTARKSQVKAVQSAAFDITPTGTKVGLTITSGAADVVTIRQVIAEGFNL
jgi:hypothetical protein